MEVQMAAETRSRSLGTQGTLLHASDVIVRVGSVIRGKLGDVLDPIKNALQLVHVIYIVGDVSAFLPISKHTPTSFSTLQRLPIALRHGSRWTMNLQA